MRPGASALELGDAYRRGATTPSEALAAILRRIEAVNPRLNAIVALDAAGAHASAAASTRRWAAGAPLGPLDGVPLTVKDNIPVAGLRCTWGSRLYAEHVPAKDELPVARLRAQGAVILGKTNVPEFTLQGYTDNPVFGPTRNPWDLALTPGGSSGGAVAAVAVGMGPLAVATDGGGSIRRPASHCGLVGLKPSLGRVPRLDGLPVILHDMEVIGPIARTVADAALLFHAMADPAAPVTTLPRLRIRYVSRFLDSPVDPEIAASLDRFAALLGSLGHRVEPGDMPLDTEAINQAFAVISQCGLAWLLRQFDGWRDRVSPPMAALAEAGLARPASDYVAALETLRQARLAAGELFTATDLLLTPAAAALPWPATESHPPAIAGMPAGPRGHAVFTNFANAAGLPAIGLPCTPAANGLPIGAQLAAAHGQDDLLLALAAEVEAAAPWADRWPEM